MGCFGSSEQTGKKTTVNALPPYLQNAAEGTVNRAVSASYKPFQAYTGEKVAPLTADQNDAFGLIRSIAGSNNPYLSDIESLYRKFSDTPASTITPASILGGDKTVGNTTIQDYMSPYIMAALQPQLEDLTRSGIAQRKGLDASATMDGAFGDARSGVALAEQLRNEMQGRAGIVGQGYDRAFTTAADLRGRDITNDINAQDRNASLLETMLQRAISGGNALKDLDASQVSRGLTTADALAKAGGVEQQTNQNKDTADLQEFLRQQGWDQQQLSWLTSILSGTPRETTSVATTEQPNNSGWGLVGSIVGSAAQALPFLISDRRAKTDISVIGATLDGLPIYRFKYLGSEVWQIGLMADDVEATMPEAVHDIKGVKLVDYGMATQAAADMGATV